MQDAISNDTIHYECIRRLDIKKVTWYQYMLIPSSLCVLLFAFLRRRQRLCLGCWRGRPGLPRPLHFLDDRHNRLFFVGGFSVTVWMLHEIIFDGMLFGITLRMEEVYNMFLDFWIRVFASVLIGIICYPIFGGVTSESLIGYAVGTLYVWAMTISFVIMNYPCDNKSSSVTDVIFRVKGVLLFIKFLPCFFWLLYLSLTYPYRFFAKLRGRKLSFSLRRDDEHGQLPYMVYVRCLLAKKIDPPTPEQKKSWKERVINWIADIYRPVKGFRYSVSILSGVFVSILLVYVVAVMIIEVLFTMDAALKNGVNVTTQVLLKDDQREDNADSTEDESENIAAFMGLLLPKLLSLFAEQELVTWMRISAYSSVVIAFVLTATSILFTLKQHRKNLLNSYRGHIIELPSYKTSPREIIVDGIRYVGCQFAFAIWGFIFQTFVITTASTGVGYAALLLIKRRDTPHGEFLVTALTVILYAVIMLVIQHLVVCLFFLQRNSLGKPILAVDNRSWFVNFQYFMIFPNATVGLTTCLIRVLKAILFSLWVLPRLDRCAIARHFEQRDKGFTAYIGLLRLESAETNPTMLTFVYLLLKAVKPKTGKTPTVTSVLMVASSDTINDPDSPEALSQQTESRLALRKRIRNRWHLIYTLQRNPSLRQYRKGAFDQVMDKERIFPKVNAKSPSEPNAKESIKEAMPKSGWKQLSKEENSTIESTPTIGSLKSVDSADSVGKAAVVKKTV